MNQNVLNISNPLPHIRYSAIALTHKQCSVRELWIFPMIFAYAPVFRMRMTTSHFEIETAPRYWKSLAPWWLPHAAELTHKRQTTSNLFSLASKYKALCSSAHCLNAFFLHFKTLYLPSLRSWLHEMHKLLCRALRHRWVCVRKVDFCSVASVSVSRTNSNPYTEHEFAIIQSLNGTCAFLCFKNRIYSRSQRCDIVIRTFQMHSPATHAHSLTHSRTQFITGENAEQ